MMNSRRQVFALAGILTATALTGGVAVAGLTHHATHPVATPAKVQVVQAAPAAPGIAFGHKSEGVE
jgi:hypothetical protein